MTRHSTTGTIGTRWLPKSDVIALGLLLFSAGLGGCGSGGQSRPPVGSPGGASDSTRAVAILRAWSSTSATELGNSAPTVYATLDAHRQKLLDQIKTYGAVPAAAAVAQPTSDARRVTAPDPKHDEGEETKIIDTPPTVTDGLTVSAHSETTFYRGNGKTGYRSKMHTVTEGSKDGKTTRYVEDMNLSQEFTNCPDADGKVSGTGDFEFIKEMTANQPDAVAHVRVVIVQHNVITGQVDDQAALGPLTVEATATLTATGSQHRPDEPDNPRTTTYTGAGHRQGVTLDPRSSGTGEYRLESSTPPDVAEKLAALLSVFSDITLFPPPTAISLAHDVWNTGGCVSLVQLNGDPTAAKTVHPGDTEEIVVETHQKSDDRPVNAHLSAYSGGDFAITPREMQGTPQGHFTFVVPDRDRVPNLDFVVVDTVSRQGKATLAIHYVRPGLTLSQILLDEGRAEATLIGAFGDVRGTVRIDGASIVVKSWTATAIVCALPLTGPGASGDVQVHVGSDVSNPLRITEWNGELRYTFKETLGDHTGALEQEETFPLHLRAWLPKGGAVLSLGLVHDSSGSYKAGGVVATANNSHSIAWSGIGDLAVFSNANPTAGKTFTFVARLDPRAKTLSAVGLGISGRGLIQQVELLDGLQQESRGDLSGATELQMALGPEYSITSGAREETQAPPGSGITLHDHWEWTTFSVKHAPD